jgi:transcriptional regulator with XRE-family HTH domain
MQRPVVGPIVDLYVFADRLQVVVDYAGGLKEVAYQIGVSNSSMYNYLGGKRSGKPPRIPTFEIVARIARYANVPADWFYSNAPEITRIKPRIDPMGPANGNGSRISEATRRSPPNQLQS